MFTKGKWNLLKVDDGHYQITAPGQTENYTPDTQVAIAEVRSWDGEPPSEQVEANARLLLAAPELYEALRGCLVALTKCGLILPAFYSDYAGTVNAAVANANAALQKAEGRS